MRDSSREKKKKRNRPSRRIVGGILCDLHHAFYAINVGRRGPCKAGVTENANLFGVPLSDKLDLVLIFLIKVVCLRFF